MNHAYCYPWFDRPTHPVPSNHHQTLLSKCLFEFGCPQLVCTVACSSKTIQNSSLAANMAFNVLVDTSTVKMFESVFDPESALSIQFTPGLSLCLYFLPNELDSPAAVINMKAPFLSGLRKTKYFSKSLRSVKLRGAPPGFLRSFLFRSPANPDPTAIDGNEKSETELVPYFENLHHLSLECSIPSADEVELIRRHGKYFESSLKSVRVRLAEFTADADVRRILGVLPHISTLILPNRMSASEATFVEFLSSSNDSFNLQNTVTSFSISHCETVNDSFLENVVSKLQNLTELSLTERLGVTGEGFSRLFQNLSASNLSKLDLSRNSQLPDVAIVEHFCAAGFRCQLVSLSLFSCTSLTDLSLEAIAANIPNLTMLNLGCCDQITDGCLLLQLPKLSKLMHLDLSSRLGGRRTFERTFTKEELILARKIFVTLPKLEKFYPRAGEKNLLFEPKKMMSEDFDEEDGKKEEGESTKKKESCGEKCIIQ